MRKFLCEYETIYTETELRDFFENECDEKDSFSSFSAWLDSCMFWNNGSLTEILTDDTPKNMESKAVVFCRVLREPNWEQFTEKNDLFGFTEDDYSSFEYVTVSDIALYRSFGFSVSVAS